MSRKRTATAAYNYEAAEEYELEFPVVDAEITIIVSPGYQVSPLLQWVQN